MNLRFRRVSSWGGALVLAYVASSATTAQGALLSKEQFDYTGTALAGQNGGTGWTGGWFTTAGSTSTNSLSNDNVSLAYPTPFEAPHPTPQTAGDRVRTGGNTTLASTSRLMATPVSLAAEGNVMFVSALFRKNAANGGAPNVANDNILLEFSDAAGNRRFGLGIEGTTDKPWLNHNASTTPSAGPAVTPGATYFIVAKVISHATLNDEYFLKVFGTGYGSQVPIAEPTTWDATGTTGTAAILDRIRLRIDQGNTAGAPGEVDQIRIGNTWGSVIPEPASWVLGLGAMAGAAVFRRIRR